MATIYNSDLSKEISDGAKIQTSKDQIPTQLAEKVVPVMEVNPKFFRKINLVRSVLATASGASNVIYATPADKDFFITNLCLSFFKDAACDAATGRIAITVSTDGLASNPLNVAITTLNLQEQTVSINFPIPLKVDRGSNIFTAQPTFAAGTFTRTASVCGFLVDNVTA